jgi:Ca-activated chloride channel family protein
MKDDDQKTDVLIDSLKQAAPKADASAKKRAIALAMAEFDLAKNQPAIQEAAIEKTASAKKLFSFQGFLNWCRLSSGNHPQADSNRSDTMKISSRNFLIGSLTTASVAVIGLVILQKPNSPLMDSPLVVNETYVTPQAQPEPVPVVIGENKGKSDNSGANENEEVVITGIRQTLKEADDTKREAAQLASAKAELKKESSAKDKVLVDSITAEDIGSLPDASVSESLQRVAGVEAKRRKEAEYAATAVESARANKAAPEPALAAAPLTERSLIPAADQIAAPKQEEFRDRFEEFKDNSVKAVAEEPVSTFSIDVDTASYSFVRRMLNNGQMPSKDAVRSEELINYFDYHYPVSDSRKVPFTTSVNLLDSPWKKGNKLIHVAIQGYQLPAKEIPQSNLVFLLDVSGSMDEPDKLPLVKQSMGLLLDTLRPDDTISIVVYAGAAGTVLEPTKAKEKTKILAALNNLQAGGSTAGAEGISLAYQLAEANFNAKGVNRIILATDGDFNVGQTDDSSLQDLVERKREKGIFLSVLGFGQGNYQDQMMQTLAQNGNGSAAYIDTLSEAQKVLVTEATSNLFPIAKDVKIQVEFNPNTVSEYRLIGYETRALNREDFSNDKIDAGEIGAGQRVTAIYEITPKGEKGLLEPSRYKISSTTNDLQAAEYAFVRLRYKLPKEDKSTLIETPVLIKAKEMNAKVESEVKFSVAVAGFSQLLRGGQFMEDFSYDDVIKLAQENKGADEFGYRNEFVQLVRKAKIAK